MQSHFTIFHTPEAQEILDFKTMIVEWFQYQILSILSVQETIL